MKVLDTHLDEGDIQQWGSSDAAAPLPSLTLGSGECGRPAAAPVPSLSLGSGECGRPSA